MNKERREELLDVVQHLDDAIDRLSEIRDDEEDAFDNLPEGLQNSIRGDSMQEAVDVLNQFEFRIYDVRSQIEEYAIFKKRKK